MAYRIRLNQGLRRVSTVARRLSLVIAKSRFVCRVEVEDSGSIRLDPVRLFKKKDYCGNHPGPCLLGGGRKHKHYTYLEGADWVAFNDLVNTVLDRLKVDARVSSGILITRKGRRRRIKYDQRFFNFDSRLIVDWEPVGDPDADYVDYCGQSAPASWYPSGTPGVYATTRSAQLRYAHVD